MLTLLIIALVFLQIPIPYREVGFFFVLFCFLKKKKKKADVSNEVKRRLMNKPDWESVLCFFLLVDWPLEVIEFCCRHFLKCCCLLSNIALTATVNISMANNRPRPGDGLSFHQNYHLLKVSNASSYPLSSENSISI